MQAPPPHIPFPRHDGKPHDPRSYLAGNPGNAIGTIKSAHSTFGCEPNEECTFIGTDGAARATRQSFEVLRFADAAWLLVCPNVWKLHDPGQSTWIWSWTDASYRPLFQCQDIGLGMRFGMHAEKAYTFFKLPRAKEALESPHGLRFWTGGQCYVHLTKDTAEVQQNYRRDVVPVKDVIVAMEDGFFDFVLRAPQFHEARFLMGEVTDRMLLQILMKSLGAKV